MATTAELIEQQFAEQKKGLGLRKKQALEEAQMGIGRRQAMGGLTGGAALKAQSKVMKDLEDVYGSQESGLAAEKARSLAGAQEAETQRQFATSERVGAQEFGSGESAKDRAQQREQFEKQHVLQQDQFRETARQFNEGMRFQWADLNESQLSNFINAMTALNHAQLGNTDNLRRITEVLETLKGRYTQTNQATKPPEFATVEPSQFGGFRGYTGGGLRG